MIRARETRIDYKSPINGYSGSLYGKKSLRILDPYGNEILHTGFRSINSYDELKKIVDDMPHLMQLLKEAIDKGIMSESDEV